MGTPELSFSSHSLMTSDTRRFHLCLLVSLGANALIFLLIGLIWQPSPMPERHLLPRIKLMILALPHVKVPVPLPRMPPKPLRVKKLVRPGAYARAARPAPATPPAGGSEAVSPAPPRAAPAPAPVSAPRVAVTERPGSRLIHNPPRSSAVIMAAIPDNVTHSTVPPTSTVSGTEQQHVPGGEAVGTGIGSGSGDGKGSGSGSGTSSEAGEPFGVGKGSGGDGGPRHVVYVLDTSGSMTSRIDRAEMELRKALKGLGPDETFNIVVFSDDARSFDTGMASGTPELKLRAENFLTTLPIRGGTNLEAAMMLALKCPDVNEIVLITDGVPTLGETNFGKIARHIRARNANHARIFTVGLIGRNPDGTDDSFEAAGLLQQIARDSRGDSLLVTLGTSAP